MIKYKVAKAKISDIGNYQSNIGKGKVYLVKEQMGYEHLLYYYKGYGYFATKFEDIMQENPILRLLS